MDISIGNFADKDIKKANEEFNKVIKELILDSEIFKKFFPSVKSIKIIGFENLLKGEAGYVEHKNKR